MFSTSDEAYHFFAPPYGFKKSLFCHLCSLLSLFCSFWSLFVCFVGPSEKACASTPVYISPPGPHQQQRLPASHLQVYDFRMLSMVFVVFSLPYTPSSSLICLLFVKNASRLRWQAQFRKQPKCEIMKRLPFGPSNSSNQHQLCPTDCTQIFSKNISQCWASR